MKKQVITYILSFLFIFISFILVAPFNPYSFYNQFMYFVEGFLPVFFFFVGLVLLLFGLIDIKERKKKKNKS